MMSLHDERYAATGWGLYTTYTLKRTITVLNNSMVVHYKDVMIYLQRIKRVSKDFLL